MQRLFAHLPSLTYWLLIGVFVGWTGWLVLTMFSVTDSGGLGVRLLSVWGDWPAHLTMSTRLAYDSNAPIIDNPLALNTPFTYPYAINLLSGMLIRAELPLIPAFVTPHVLALAGALICVALWFQRLLRPTWVAGLAFVLWITSGGLGYTDGNLQKLTATISSAISDPNVHLTFNQEQNIHWGSLLYTQLLPQRAMSLGLLVGILTLFLAQYALWNSNASRTARTLAAVAAATSLIQLPYIHTHSTVAVLWMLGIWVGWEIWQYISKKSGDRSLAPLITLVIGGVAAVLIQLSRTDSASVQGAVELQIGWYAHSLTDWIVFWWNNWGLVPYLSIVGIALSIRKVFKHGSEKSAREHKIILIQMLSAASLFMVINSIQLQPYIWDNTKLLVWTALGFAAFASYAIKEFFDYLGARASGFRFAGYSLLAIILMLSVLGGVMDMASLSNQKVPAFELYTGEELALSRWVKAETSVDAIWLTGDRHNHWVSNLTGRQVLITYSGWLWSHATPHEKQLAAMKELYQHPERADLTREWGITHAVIGKYEQDSYDAKPELFDQHHQRIYTTESYILYQLNQTNHGETNN